MDLAATRTTLRRSQTLPGYRRDQHPARKIFRQRNYCLKNPLPHLRNKLRLNGGCLRLGPPPDGFGTEPKLLLACLAIGQTPPQCLQLAITRATHSNFGVCTCSKSKCDHVFMPCTASLRLTMPSPYHHYHHPHISVCASISRIGPSMLRAAHVPHVAPAYQGCKAGISPRKSMTYWLTPLGISTKHPTAHITRILRSTVYESQRKPRLPEWRAQSRPCVKCRCMDGWPDTRTTRQR